MTKRSFVGVGLPVPTYSGRDFSQIPAGIRMEDVWQIVGPNVDMHIRALPLWKVFCAVYLEGLAHGAQATAIDAARSKT